MPETPVAPLEVECVPTLYGLVGETNFEWCPIRIHLTRLGTGELTGLELRGPVPSLGAGGAGQKGCSTIDVGLGA